MFFKTSLFVTCLCKEIQVTRKYSPAPRQHLAFGKTVPDLSCGVTYTGQCVHAMETVLTWQCPSALLQLSLDEHHPVMLNISATSTAVAEFPAFLPSKLC